MISLPRTILLCLCVPFMVSGSSSSSPSVPLMEGRSLSRPTQPHRRKIRQHKLPTTFATPTIVHRGGEITKNINLTTKSAVLFGMILALNSGYVNGLCLSGILAHDGTKQASAAVTGAWTNSALGVASGNYQQFAFNTKCILSYITGSAIAGVLNPDPVPFQVPSIQVGSTFGIGSVLLYLSSTHAGKDGSMTFLYLAAIANGIQNSVTSVITSNLVRSAHFSGISSDIGTFVGQVLRGNTANLLKLKVFSLLASCFWIGGMVSYSMVNNFNAASLLFSAALYLVIALGLVIPPLLPSSPPPLEKKNDDQDPPTEPTQ